MPVKGNKVIGLLIVAHSLEVTVFGSGLISKIFEDRYGTDLLEMTWIYMLSPWARGGLVEFLNF